MSINIRSMAARLAAVMLSILLFLSACQLPASQPVATLDANLLLTQGAETVQVELTRAAGELTLEAPLSIPATQTVAALLTDLVSQDTPTSAPPTPEPTQTSGAYPPPPTPSSTQAPTIEATPSPSHTPDAPTATPTLVVGQITAVRDTNCRQGPGANFEVISGLRSGRTAAVYGKDSSGEWWFISRPSGKVNDYCWVWGETTEIQGDEDDYPVIPPYPLQLDPAVTQWNFSVNYVNITTCGGPFAVLSIDNIGYNDLESAYLELFDATASRVLSSAVSNRPFLFSDSGCGQGVDTLEPGMSAFVGGSLAGSLSGNTIAANLRLCTDDELKDKCYFTTISFVMP